MLLRIIKKVEVIFHQTKVIGNILHVLGLESHYAVHIL